MLNAPICQHQKGVLRHFWWNIFAYYNLYSLTKEAHLLTFPRKPNVYITDKPLPSDDLVTQIHWPCLVLWTRNYTGMSYYPCCPVLINGCQPLRRVQGLPVTCPSMPSNNTLNGHQMWPRHQVLYHHILNSNIFFVLVFVVTASVKTNIPVTQHGASDAKILGLVPSEHT